MEIKVSVIVPVYNVEKYISKCIDSVLEQELNEVEIILVDDGSTDSSGEIIDNYKLNFSDKIIAIHQKNTGQGGARNKGIDIAKGKYIFFLDSDDYIEKDTLSTLYETAEKRKSDLVLFNCKVVRENGHVVQYMKNYLPDGEWSLETYPSLMFGFIGPVCKLYKSNLLKSNKIYFPKYYFYEDVPFAFQVFLHTKKAVYVDRNFYNYLMRVGSTMNSNKDKLDRNLDIIKMFDMVRENYINNNGYEKYYEELEYVVTFNVYLGTSIRVILIDTKSYILEELKKYMDKNYGDFMKNKYLRKHKMEWILCWMIKNKMYSLVKILVLIKRKIQGNI